MLFCRSCCCCCHCCSSSLLAFEKVKGLFWLHLSVLLANLKSSTHLNNALFVQFYHIVIWQFLSLVLKISTCQSLLWIYGGGACLPSPTPHLADLKHLSSAFPYQQSMSLLFLHCTNITHVIIRPSANIIILFLSFRYHFNLVFSIRNVHHPQIVFTRDKQMDSSHHLS